MAGLPNIQTAQYGDRAALEKLGATRSTNNPAVDVQTTKNMQGGRPSTQDISSTKFDPMQYAMAQIKGQPEQPQYSPTELDHQRQLNSLAEMKATAMKLVRVANRPNAGSLAQGTALAAIRAYQQEFMRVRGITPFFDGV